MVFCHDFPGPYGIQHTRPGVALLCGLPLVSECLQSKNLRPAEGRIGKSGQFKAWMVRAFRIHAFCIVVTESQKAMV